MTAFRLDAPRAGRPGSPRTPISTRRTRRTRRPLPRWSQDLARMQAEQDHRHGGHPRSTIPCPDTISLFKDGARAADDLTPPYQGGAAGAGRRNGASPRSGAAMRSSSSAYTSDFYLVAADRKLTDDGMGRGATTTSASISTCSSRPSWCRRIITVHLPAAGLSRSRICWRRCRWRSHPADDPGAAAVLDLASGAHDKLDRAVAGAGRGERTLLVDWA